ncbi:hypothetical protein PG985_003153 [Apiospora marii]|uniref:uncharacterized protein n=1 Tax=Apiospora marii TaxID=335849 RepID=UPI00312E8B51
MLENLGVEAQLMQHIKDVKLRRVPSLTSVRVLRETGVGVGQIALCRLDELEGRRHQLAQRRPVLRRPVPDDAADDTSPDADIAALEGRGRHGDVEAPLGALASLSERRGGVVVQVQVALRPGVGVRVDRHHERHRRRRRRLLDAVDDLVAAEAPQLQPPARRVAVPVAGLPHEEGAGGRDAVVQHRRPALDQAALGLRERPGLGGAVAGQVVLGLARLRALQGGRHGRGREPGAVLGQPAQPVGPRGGLAPGGAAAPVRRLEGAAVLVDFREERLEVRLARVPEAGDVAQLGRGPVQAFHGPDFDSQLRLPRVTPPRQPLAQHVEHHGRLGVPAVVVVSVGGRGDGDSV